jgi:hypothetical protein
MAAALSNEHHNILNILNGSGQEVLNLYPSQSTPPRSLIAIPNGTSKGALRKMPAFSNLPGKPHFYFP